jgi:hypothetical protein
MIEAWLPTAVSLCMLGLLGYFIRNSLQTLRSDYDRDLKNANRKIELVSERLNVDEKEYLTRDTHELICSGQQQGVKLHINDVIRKMREENDKKTRELWKRLDELREMIKENGKKT